MLDFGTNRTITVSGPAIPVWEGMPLLQIRALRGEERLGEIYAYTLELATPSEPWVFEEKAANINLQQMIGKSLTITIQLEGMEHTHIGEGIREISGLVFAAHYRGQEERRGRYEVVIKPWLALTQGRTNYRIFQHQSVIDIVTAVLGNYPFSFEKRLSFTYPTLDFQTQFGESDYSFLQRLMQENGIYWFFEHAGGFHTMILVDFITAHRRTKSEAYHVLPYHPPERRTDQEHISEFDVVQTWQSGLWTTGDYDFKQQNANLEKQVGLPQQTALNKLERYEWPGDYTDWDQGQRFATVRMQEINARGLRAYGRGNLRDVECGTLFTLVDYPQKSANCNYVVLAAGIRATEIGDVTGRAHAEYRFEITFEAQPDTEVFRPGRTIPKPRTSGPQMAEVTGADGNRIWSDIFARVRIRFHWDRYGSDDENSSCWVRVMYPWAGGEFGSVSIPRIGTEVIVDFVNGDPDRPIVVGQMYRQFDLPPWQLPANQVLSGYRSQELDGGRANFLALDDTPGKIQAQLSSDEGQSRLSLGYITRIAGNEGRKDERGRGFELRTDEWGVVRSAKGMLITTDASDGMVKDIEEPLARLSDGYGLHTSLSELATQHAAQDELPQQQTQDAGQATDDGQDTEKISQQHATQTISTQNGALKGGTGSSDNPFPELTRPDLVIAGAAGVAVTAGDSTHLVSRNDHSVTAGRDVSISSGRSLMASVRSAISLFAYQLGMKLMAAKGKIEIQTQSDDLEVVADQVLKLISLRKRVEISAAQEIILHAGGSYLRLGSTGIEEGTAAGWVVHAASHEFVGPKSLPAQLVPRASTVVKAVTNLYWSYDDDCKELFDISRHYVDMNLHVETIGFNPGEVVHVTLTHSDGEDIIDDQKELTYDIPVDENGTGVLKKIVSDKIINLL